MKNHFKVFIRYLGLAAMLAFACNANAQFIHLSFDSSSLSVSGGNITGAADSTGNHNATLGTGVGSAPVVNGGPTFTSNPIPLANSVAGRFGEGLTLSGNGSFVNGGGQFLMFPNLTELMTANSGPGAPSYTVSYWLNTTIPGTADQHNYSVLSDWGNAASNPGRYTYAYGFQFSNGEAQMRAQTRNNPTGSGNGSDIFARPVTTASLNDGNWHMLTWTFDTGLGELKSYFDGTLVDTFVSMVGNGNYNMILSSSPFGTIGLKGDNGRVIEGAYIIDELWVVPGVMTEGEIRVLRDFNIIPEPGVFTLLGVGAVIFGFVRRRAYARSIG